MPTSVWGKQMLAQDKGGPSKGGFLNNRLSSYTDLYVCTDTNGMCSQTIHYSERLFAKTYINDYSETIIREDSYKRYTYTYIYIYIY